MFKKIFGGGKPKEAGTPPPVSQGATAANQTINTIQRLTETEEQLEKRKALLEKRVEAELNKAREFTKQQKKPQALQCLKKKKLLETQVQQLDNMIMRVIEQRNMLEGQRTTVEVLSSMHAAAQTAKTNMSTMKIDNVDKVLDEIQDTNSQMQQINDALNVPTQEFDEDELLGELEDLESTALDEEMLAPASVPTTKVPQKGQTLPSVPAQKAPVKKTAEEEELEALQAEMAL